LAVPPGNGPRVRIQCPYKVSPDGKLLYVFQDDILVFDLATFKQVDKIALAQPEYPGATPYRLSANEDSFDAPDTVTSVFTSVDEVVHKGNIGSGKDHLLTRKVDLLPDWANAAYDGLPGLAGPKAWLLGDAQDRHRWESLNGMVGVGFAKA